MNCVDVYSNPLEEQQKEDGSSSPDGAAAADAAGATTQCCNLYVFDALELIYRTEDVKTRAVVFLRSTACMLSVRMLSQFRLSLCPSVRPSVTRVDQSKTAEVRIIQF